MNTKDKILEVSLSMFSASGYNAVSIRDICGEVGIKESSIYYHFKNKQDILDSLMNKFEEYINSLLLVLQSQTVTGRQGLSFDWMDIYFFNQYLFDPFCNKMMRLMLNEQFHNEKLREAYEKWLFTEPRKIETGVFLMLAEVGIMSYADATRTGLDFHAYMTMLTYKYLLLGELTTEKKDIFRKEAHLYMESIFERLGGNENV